MDIQHTCPDASMAVQALCEDGSVGGGDIVILVAATLALVALGVFVWVWNKRRFQ